MRSKKGGEAATTTLSPYLGAGQGVSSRIAQISIILNRRYMYISSAAIASDYPMQSLLRGLFRESHPRQEQKSLTIKARLKVRAMVVEIVS